MWEHAGLVRNAAGLGHAASVIAQWAAQTRDPRTEAEFETENLLLVSAEVVRAALARAASVGAHFRSDDVIDRADASAGLIASPALIAGAA